MMLDDPNLLNTKALKCSNPSSGVYPKEQKGQSWRGICTLTIIATLSPTAKRWKQLKHPWMDGG